MNINIGDKAVVTTFDWFHAPDGQSYKAVFGTIKGIYNAEEVLGIISNKHSTNWYLEIGNVVIAGCQIHYLVKTDKFENKPFIREWDFEDKLIFKEAPSRVYVSEE